MTTALDIVTRSMRAIGAIATGEVPAANEANDGFDLLNDLLETWSNATMMIPYITEIIFTLTGNTYQYTIGPGGTIGSTFTGSVVGNTLTITAMTAGEIALGEYISLGGYTWPPTAQITGFLSGSGQAGTYEVTNPNNTLGSGSQSMFGYYQRPLRINSAFVRVATLDYPVTPLNVEQYEQIGLKTRNGPWPRVLYYQPSFPLGNITFWPVPGSGQMHMFAETVLAQFASLSDPVNLPQGYAMALRWNLAEMMLPEYGKNDPTMISMIRENASQSRAWIKRTNMAPPANARYDDALLSMNRRNDAAWIFSGGFTQ